jgi:hypothetical protein
MPDMFQWQLASNFSNLREKRKAHKATVPGGQFGFVRSTCGKESGCTFGCACSNQLAVELVEML